MAAADGRFLSSPSEIPALAGWDLLSNPQSGFRINHTIDFGGTQTVLTGRERTVYPLVQDEPEKGQLPQGMEAGSGSREAAAFLMNLWQMTGQNRAFLPGSKPLELGDGSGSGKTPEYNQNAYKAMQERYDYYKSDPGYDCSEIAEDLYNVANGDGKVYRITPKEGKMMIGEEFGISEKWYYHEVYSDGYYIYDPMFSDTPILKDDYFSMLNGQLNNSNLLVVETVPYSVR